MAVEKPRVKVNETNFGFRGQKHTFEVSISGKGTYNDSDERVKWKDWIRGNCDAPSVNLRKWMLSWT